MVHEGSPFSHPHPTFCLFPNYPPYPVGVPDSRHHRSLDAACEYHELLSQEGILDHQFLLAADQISGGTHACDNRIRLGVLQKLRFDPFQPLTDDRATPTDDLVEHDGFSPGNDDSLSREYTVSRSALLIDYRSLSCQAIYPL